MSNWTNISKHKKIKSLNNNKIMLIAPTDTSSVVPLFCPCCKFPMKSSEDGISFRKIGVCNHCNERWTNKPGVKWPTGPDKNSYDWKEYIEFRTKLAKPVIVFK